MSGGVDARCANIWPQIHADWTRVGWDSPHGLIGAQMRNERAEGINNPSTRTVFTCNKRPLIPDDCDRSIINLRAAGGGADPDEPGRALGGGCALGAADQKAEWLERWELIKNTEHRMDPALIICSNKKLINADILIDDRLETIKEWPNKGIVFAQPWNVLSAEEAVRYTRCNGWSETMKYLEDYCG